MPRCKYVGRGYDKWLPKDERCESEVRTVVDRDRPSESFRSSEFGHVVLFPSKKCPSGMCEYHFNKIRFAKLKVGRQS